VLNAKNLSLVSVQVAQARKVAINGRSILTAIHKTQAHGPVAVAALGLQGDEQADLSVHGGLEKAVYAYSAEHYGFWQGVRQKAGVSDIDAQLNHGAMGENLTLSGLLESDVWVGDVLHFPRCTLRVSQPREPCYKFNAAMGFNTAVREMALSGFCGFYLSVDEPGVVQAGESFELLPGPRHVSIPQRFQAKMFKHLR
jgi:MOSC domain-containing protein YiiM